MYKYCPIVSFYRESWWAQSKLDQSHQSHQENILEFHFQFPGPSSIFFHWPYLMKLNVQHSVNSNSGGAFLKLPCAQGPRSLWKCRFWFIRSRVGPRLAHKLQVILGPLACGPHLEYQGQRTEWVTLLVLGSDWQDLNPDSATLVSSFLPSTALLLSARIYTVKSTGTRWTKHTAGHAGNWNQKIHVLSKAVAAVYLDFTVTSWKQGLVLPDLLSVQRNLHHEFHIWGEKDEGRGRERKEGKEGRKEGKKERKGKGRKEGKIFWWYFNFFFLVWELLKTF